MQAINGEISERGKQNIDITLDKYNGLVKIKLRGGAFIHFDDELYRMLGLKDKSVSESVRGHLPVDVNNGFYGMYVYCDIVQNQLVGDVSAPLLRVVPLQTSWITQGDMIAHTFNTPHYVPIKTKNFEVVHVDIRKDTGEKIPFQRGKLTIALHFRRTRPTLF